jgi:hypothetical protein
VPEVIAEYLVTFFRASPSLMPLTWIERQRIKAKFAELPLTSPNFCFPTKR